MKTPTLGNPQNTIEILQKYNFNFQKKFGQNFLIDEHVLDKIIRAAEITKDDYVLEIGPGIGTMTQYLACAAREVTAVEIDRALIPILEDTLKEYDNVSIINEDILKVDIAALAKEKNGGRPIKVVANLPYYITTPIIMGLFESHVPLESITVMVQKEVADRMQVGPGTKDYGALSLAVQYYAAPGKRRFGRRLGIRWSFRPMRRPLDIPCRLRRLWKRPWWRHCPREQPRFTYSEMGHMS